MTNSDPKKRLHEIGKENIVRIRNAFNIPRDPARIQVVLDKLRDVWQKNPDLRLAQLIVNVSGRTQPCPEIFYLEDDVLLRGLTAYDEKHTVEDANAVSKNISPDSSSVPLPGKSCQSDAS